MKLNMVRNLIFSYVTSQELVREATGWKYEEKDIKGVFEDARVFETYESRKRYNLKFGHSLHQGVQLMLHMLNGLDYDTLVNKEKQMANRHDQLRKNHLPLYLSRDEKLKIARKGQWQRYDAALALTGMVLDETARKEFVKLMFNRDYNGNEYRPDLRYFPMLEAFSEFDDQLLNSGLFPNSHRTYYYDKAPTLEIMSWVKRMEIELPHGLFETVKKFQDQESAIPNTKKAKANESQAACDDKMKLNVRERESLLLLVNAMAKAKFGFLPDESFGPAIQKIDSAIRDTTASLSDKTIRRYLKESEEALRVHLERKNQ